MGSRERRAHVFSRQESLTLERAKCTPNRIGDHRASEAVPVEQGDRWGTLAASLDPARIWHRIPPLLGRRSLDGAESKSRRERLCRGRYLITCRKDGDG